MRTAAMVLGVASVLLGACSSSDAPPQDATPAPTQAGPGAEFTSGVTVGANAAPAKLQFRIGATPVVGRNVAVAVRVTPTVEVEKLQASFEVEPGLAFPDDAQTSFVTDRLAAGATHPYELQVRPEQAGVHVLKVTVMTDVDGASRTSTFAIPLIVAAADAPAAPAPAPAAPATGG
jgi:hypothetical protein